jgi:chromosome segregation ATPase
MTTRREVPISADTLAWVHNELADIKARLASAQQAAEQSRGLAGDASEKAFQAQQQVEQLDGVGPALLLLQDELRAVRDQLTRAQEEIVSLRQTRDESERRFGGEAEQLRRERNEVTRGFGELEREIAGWQDRLTNYEEHNRRNLETSSQLVQRVEAIEAQIVDTEALNSRAYTAANRIEIDLQRIAGLFPAIEREDDAQRERINTVLETLRRLEAEIEALKVDTSRIGRLDDRLELVQAERTRHNERITEITTQLAKVETRINEHSERAALIEVRIAGYQEELRRLKERLHSDRDQIGGYLHALKELEADMRKRQIIALEKEIRDVRGRALNFAEE